MRGAPAAAAGVPAFQCLRPPHEGDDAHYTRRQDVLTPIPKFRDEALYTMLPLYGVHRKIERRKLIKRGALHQLARVPQECNWGGVAESMDAFDQRRG